MTGKSKQASNAPSSKFEVEALRLRNENKWNRLHEFASSQLAKDKRLGILYKTKYVAEKKTRTCDPVV